MLLAARDSGLSLLITGGVLEELERHMNRCLAYARTQNGFWEGDIPYLFAAYIYNGRAEDGFVAWLEIFRGEARPLDDVADYLMDAFGIKVSTLKDEVASADTELRSAIQEAWIAIHQKRRKQDETRMAMGLNRLADHDVENYLGVIRRREQEERSHFGYKAWWLTLDSEAFGISDTIRRTLHVSTPSSPVLSPDFLVNYLAFGPVRNKLGKQTEAALPVVVDPIAIDYLTPDLLAFAREIRENYRSLPENVIRRKVRDHLDLAKRTRGAIATGGLPSYDRQIARY